jgi:hypothetical protein
MFKMGKYKQKVKFAYNNQHRVKTLLFATVEHRDMIHNSSTFEGQHRTERFRPARLDLYESGTTG